MEYLSNLHPHGHPNIQVLNNVLNLSNKPIANRNKLDNLGFVHRLICPTPQNGAVERKHRHIVDMALTLLSQASIPISYGDHAFHTAVYLINRVPSPSHNSNIPLSALF